MWITHINQRWTTRVQFCSTKPVKANIHVALLSLWMLCYNHSDAIFETLVYNYILKQHVFFMEIHASEDGGSGCQRARQPKPIGPHAHNHPRWWHTQAARSDCTHLTVPLSTCLLLSKCIKKGLLQKGKSHSRFPSYISLVLSLSL